MPSQADNDVIIATDDDATVKKEEVTVPLFKDDKVWFFLALKMIFSVGILKNNF